MIETGFILATFPFASILLPYNVASNIYRKKN